jgi:hypothetical protein
MKVGGMVKALDMNILLAPTGLRDVVGGLHTHQRVLVPWCFGWLFSSGLCACSEDRTMDPFVRMII